MKHLWKYIAGALAFALPVASCSDDNTSDFPDKEWGELTAPVLTVSEEEITLDANKACPPPSSPAAAAARAA